ncbi:MAG: flagellar biosynthesis anti-sigma factor FlgM [Acidobacteriota bacterium]|nr:flagellar biosynthesis anti-sigma factor FlgM [Acidobacteriota bacterium]
MSFFSVNMGMQSAITGLAATDRAQAGSAAGSSSSATQAQGGVADQAQLSQSGALLAQSDGDASVREARVSALQAAVQSGTYHVSAGAVADALVTHMLNMGQR